MKWRLSKPHPAIQHGGQVPAGFWSRWQCRYLGVDGVKSAGAAGDRVAVPIMAAVGSNGGGKSACAVYSVLGTLDGIEWECSQPDHRHRHRDECTIRVGGDCSCPADGPVRGLRTVYSTLTLLNAATGDPHPLWRPLRSFVTLADVEHADVILDEVTGIASARAHQSLPAQIENLIMQLRRRDVRMIWTTPDYSAADVRLRQVTQGVVYCKGLSRVSSGIKGRVWKDSRLFRWSLYDAQEFDEFTAGKRERTKPLSTQFVWRPGHLLERSYNTLASVQTIGHVSEGGMCMSCGGRRSAPKCSCPLDPSLLPEGIEEEVTAAGGRRRKVVGT